MTQTKSNKVCVECGKPFVLARSYKLCSAACRAKRKRRQMAAHRLAAGHVPAANRCVVCNSALGDAQQSRRVNTCSVMCNRVKRNLAAALSRKRAYSLPDVRRAEISRALARYYETNQAKRRPIGQQLAILEKALLERSNNAT